MNVAKEPLLTPIGFTGDGFTCSDIDECADGLDDCDVNADCNDTLGGFECTCIAGWKGNGTFCENMDECTGLWLNLGEKASYKSVFSARGRHETMWKSSHCEER